MYTFSPSTRIKSAEVNQNFTDLSTGVADTIANSLAETRKRGFVNFVSSGYTVPTSASLTATIAAGVAFVNGLYVSRTAVAKTFTASKDTYIDLLDNGTIVYIAVTNNVGTGFPISTNTDGTAGLRLAKVVTSATAITSVQQYGYDLLGNLVYNTSPIARQDPVTFVSMGGGWVNYGLDNWANAGYNKDALNIVRVRGLIKNGSNNSVIFTLPVGYRPVTRIMFTGFSDTGPTRLDVNPDGTVVQGGGGTVYSTLNPIQFRAEQ
jgi:hypothetical protein